MDNILKQLLVFMFIVGGLMLLGVQEEEKSKRKPWYKPPIKHSVREHRTHITHIKRVKSKASSSWASARREKTEAWADFLEELEMRGYDIYDPEAEDIWTEFD